MSRLFLSSPRVNQAWFRTYVWFLLNLFDTTKNQWYC
jgi:hypothetical protein